MALLQCKMCGGSVELPQGVTYGECPYCGSLTTFPSQDDERLLQLSARAEHYRQLNDFDKALETYDKLIDLKGTDPDAHWGRLLSRYGIEYVEDPTTHERIPTCHRVQINAILADSDYLTALECSSGSERSYYEEQARKIADIQKQILAISSQEQPYDVFICYKETSEAGTRTLDSSLAQDIYYQLVNQNYKVFFSRITLEDKLGQQYEPYIFSALNSAKVMLVVGTKPEYFKAVWVKNEWSRFLALMNEDKARTIIPCYRDMSPYELPEELSMLQSQDMSKIGFIQDLIHGIQKILDVQEQHDNSHSDENNAGPSTHNLLQRVKFFLQDKDFEKALEYCFRILDSDPDNLEAFFLQFLAELKMSDENGLPESDTPPDELGSCKVILRSQNTKLREKTQKIIRKYQQLPAFVQAIEGLEKRLGSIPHDTTESLEAFFLERDPAEAIPLVDTLQQALELLKKAPDISMANTLSKHIMSLFMKIIMLLKQQNLLECLLGQTDDFSASYPDLNKNLAKYHVIDSPPKQLTEARFGKDNPALIPLRNQLKEEAVGDLMFKLFDLLGNFENAPQLREEFEQNIYAIKYKQAIAAKATSNYILMAKILRGNYLKYICKLDKMRQDTFTACANTGASLFKTNRLKEALPYFIVCASQDFQNAMKLAIFCADSLKQKQEKQALLQKIGIKVGVGILIVLLLGGIIASC